MLDTTGNVLYVGKAKNLKKRITSYFKRQLDTKTLQLVRRIHHIEVTLTRNEREALLLELNLIKKLKPRYNIIFRDDKSYPYLRLSSEDFFARFSFYRGNKKEEGLYYGPYPSSVSAKEALNVIQGIFQLRQCSDDFFKKRKTPCLQYQIKRCSAPCVGYIDSVNYQKNVEDLKVFLSGKNSVIVKCLNNRMLEASANQQYEKAAVLRDQIVHLKTIQEQQIIMNAKGNVDVLGFYQTCVHRLSIREGNIIGSRSHFLEETVFIHDAEESLLKSFIIQFYLNDQKVMDWPDDCIIPMEIPDQNFLSSLLTQAKSAKVNIIHAKGGEKLKWIEMANASAKQAYCLQASQHPVPANLAERFSALQSALNLELPPERLECFDISHSLGEATVASCVVLSPLGPLKSEYRYFNIKAHTKGDDYAAMSESLTRRYTRLLAEKSILPDILVIDGGKGQLQIALSVLQALQMSGIMVLAVAKGLNRKSGLEKLFLCRDCVNSEIEVLATWEQNNPAFHLIQYIRDEAHRFAIRMHRKKRSKTRVHSILERIPGIGKQRRLQLLQYFGGLQEIKKASVEALVQVPGINKVLAEKIYVILHEGEEMNQ